MAVADDADHSVRVAALTTAATLYATGRRPPTSESPAPQVRQPRLGEAALVSLSAAALASAETQGHQRDNDVTPSDGDDAPESEPIDSEHVETTSSDTELTPAEKEEVAELKARDAEVRRHEQAHATTGGSYAGSPSYEFQRGPDGRNYAVGGEVQIDVSAVPGDPQATIEKMQVVIAAALAPAEPSGADRSVAREAQQTMAEARAEALEADEAGDPAAVSASESATETSTSESEAAPSSAAPTASLAAYLQAAGAQGASAAVGQLIAFEA